VALLFPVSVPLCGIFPYLKEKPMAPRNDDMSGVMALLEILRILPKSGAISTTNIHEHLLDAGYNISDRTALYESAQRAL